MAILLVNRILGLGGGARVNGVTGLKFFGCASSDRLIVTYDPVALSGRLLVVGGSIY